MSGPDPLAERLVAYGYAPLLGENPDASSVESIRAEPDVGPRLLRIVNDRGVPWQARFLAAEFLFRYVDMTLLARAGRESLQESYLQALRENYTGNGADWGFRLAPDDLGPLGHAVAGWGGDTALFSEGLDDERIVDVHFPWGPPPHYHPPYRVKDFAALILSRVHGVPVDLSGAPADRDRAIAALARTLDAA